MKMASKSASGIARSFILPMQRFVLNKNTRQTWLYNEVSMENGNAVVKYDQKKEFEINPKSWEFSLEYLCSFLHKV